MSESELNDCQNDTEKENNTLGRYNRMSWLKKIAVLRTEDRILENYFTSNLHGVLKDHAGFNIYLLPRKSHFHSQDFRSLLLIALHILWHIWEEVLKNEPSKIRGRQPLKDLKGYVLPKAEIFCRLSSTNFTRSILEYFLPYVTAR